MHENLNKLRNFLIKNQWQGLIVSRSSEYLGEIVPQHREYLKWLVNFQGSKGLLIATTKQSALFLDSRYEIYGKTLQNNDLTVLPWKKETIIAWINSSISPDKPIYYDQRFHSSQEVNYFSQIFQVTELKTLDENPLEQLTEKTLIVNRNNVILHQEHYSGEKLSSKKEWALEYLQKNNLETLIITSPDNICWLFNIRGNDIPFSPIPEVLCIITKEGFELFVDTKNKTNTLQKHVGKSVTLYTLEEFYNRLAVKNSLAQIDQNWTPISVANYLNDHNIKFKYCADPISTKKSIKNPTEIHGAKKAALKDGIATCKLFYWIDQQYEKGKNITEGNISDKFIELKKLDNDFMGASFQSISAWGKNGALPHYCHLYGDNSILGKDNFYLLDTGSQYPCGTTDFTRTIFMGPSAPKLDHVTSYTAVLQGFIDLAQTIFPAETSGVQLDAIARRPLWLLGKNYSHGTGHGVGSFLHVHEAPIIIAAHDVSYHPLGEGAILSIEPGYYKKNYFGIRIENLFVIRKANYKNMLEFESLTLAPIDTKAIDKSKLTIKQLNWLNQYHKDVYNSISPYLNKENRSWLKLKTQKI